jgi:electron transport complex protein RnfC
MRARFSGGLDLPGLKLASAACAIRPCPLPPELVLPLRQHPGLPARALVAPGDRVRRGQCLAQAQDDRGAALHAPAAGLVVAIEPSALPQAPGEFGDCLRLRPEAGGASELLEPWTDWEDRAPQALRQRIAAAGIVGLGGATFPAAAKLERPVELLLLNGAECEPWIACDDALLRERADQVVLGGRVLRRATGAARVLLAIEDTMPQAHAAAAAAIEAHGAGEVELASVASRYPQGGERQLIQALAQREVPRGGLPQDLGIVVFNVGTAAACWHAVFDGEPLLSRIVSVTGPGVAQPGNFEVALGTPISHLVAQAGGYTARAARLVSGGPMMGVALPNDDFPITKASNCVLVLEQAATPSAPEMPCIRCGDCAQACPAQLLPQQLHWHARGPHADRLREFGLDACIECGCCDLVCPSRIPLTAQFRWAKAELAAQAGARVTADAARARHLARQQRLERDAAERVSTQAAQGAAASPDAVQAALARARAKRREGGPREP